MADYLILIPLLPLVAAIINLLLGRTVTRGKAHLVSVPAVAGSWFVSLLVLRDIWNTEHAIEQKLFTWIPSGSFNVPVNLYADQLTAVMLMVVTSVGLLVHIYSIGYMHGDGAYYRFFAYLPLFVFSMLMLVLADNYMIVFFFWEAVGLCSFLLIGYYYKRRSAGNAAKKAFIVNRVGDLGFGLGVIMIFWTFGTVNFWGPEGVFARVGDFGQTTITVIALLLFTGAIGKSAQFPLHVWLPDAMEGPTPVSALIHAATMVTAGIYLVARSNALFQASTTAMLVVTCIGLFTAVMGASIAITQNDIKRIVAYSTVSQLGFMAFALGTGAWMAAIFHLMTHAFFKGLLFLGCGSVIHGMHEEQDIQKMGNLRKYMPVTFLTFLIGSLANAGIFPLAGFWSKDEIIVGAWISTVFPNFGKVVTVLAFAAAFMTAFYMFRLVFKVFFGKENFDTEHVHPHESPKTMTGPLVILAVATILIGFVGFPPEDGKFHHFIGTVFESHAGEATHAMASVAVHNDGGALAVMAEEGEHGGHHVSLAMTITFGVISSVVAIGGIFLAYLYYIRRSLSAEATAARFNGLYNFLYNRWGFDTLYQERIVAPLMRLAYFLWQVIDVKVIDGTVNGIAKGTLSASQTLRKVQTGVVSNYALAIALGMVVIIGIYLVGFSSLDVPFLR
ncbi:MAG: NADH-quinone oxidoreductase subunit L [Thermomicrobiales bacterium]|nr:NADH-quinone oxidoreductase subunit L [Thermomicrobiales bacterium]